MRAQHAVSNPVKRDIAKSWNTTNHDKNEYFHTSKTHLRTQHTLVRKNNKIKRKASARTNECKQSQPENKSDARVCV